MGIKTIDITEGDTIKIRLNGRVIAEAKCWRDDLFADQDGGMVTVAIAGKATASPFIQFESWNTTEPGSIMMWARVNRVRTGAKNKTRAK